MKDSETNQATYGRHIQFVRNNAMGDPPSDAPCTATARSKKGGDISFVDRVQSQYIFEYLVTDS